MDNENLKQLTTTLQQLYNNFTRTYKNLQELLGEN